ncbi:hypothetical protein T4A_14039 [Trichinella pseudospiralis]|uniref:Uncharacterized protein n=1 Tax=Trichinella pseudospiralis TaxID=6337 RepID=A0A0V1CWG3_TRIPS|nr:hypothetical protein T4A_14039 [Trichinella pseudospiralis]
MGHLRLSYPGKIFPRIAGYLKCSIPKRKNLAYNLIRRKLFVIFKQP